MLIVATTFFGSCDKNDISEESYSSSLASKSVTSGNTLYNTGYGYNVLKIRPFNFAIDIRCFEDKIASDFYPSIDTKIEVINDNEDLNNFIISQQEIENDGLFELKTNLEEKITFSENQVSVIAKVKIKQRKYQLKVNKPLQFDRRAANILESGQINRFLSKYGNRYVESAVLGGDLYYIYSYNISEFDERKKIDFEKSIKINAENIYGEESNYLSEEVKEEITNALTDFQVFSDVPGYSPSLVSDTNSFHSEIQQLTDYLDENPILSAVKEMVFKPYSDIIELPELENSFFEENKCYKDLTAWKRIEARILFVYNNTSDSATKAKAKAALEEISQKIDMSINCLNSSYPNENLYADITL